MQSYLQLCIRLLQQTRPDLSSVAAVVEHRFVILTNRDEVINNNRHPATIAPEVEGEYSSVEIICEGLVGRNNSLINNVLY